MCHENQLQILATMIVYGELSLHKKDKETTPFRPFILSIPCYSSQVCEL